MAHSIKLISVITVIAFLAVACGDDGDDGAQGAEGSGTAASAASEGEYCKAVREWAVVDLDPRRDEDPVWFREHWTAYRDFVATAERTAPEPLEAAWAIFGDNVDAQTTVFETYDYDVVRGREQGTPEEAAVFEPDEATQQAFAGILANEALTCDAWRPLAADVDFSGEEPGSYCEAVAAVDEYLAPAGDSGWRPDEVRALLVGDGEAELTRLVEALRSDAPPVIEAEVAAVADWLVDEGVSALAENDFDVRKLLLDGTAEQRQAFQSTAPGIRDEFALVAAYEEQICGA
jgi:hypothetical protein